MIFLKVGKTKHKFKLNFIVAKYKYHPEVNKVRGSHEIEIFSGSTKKGSIKFPKTQYTIPMTLFYDESSNQYLQKTVEIKTYICDDNDKIIRTIGKTELNIAEYAHKQKFGLEVEIEGQNKKIQQDVIITLQMTLQRQDDDSKSVNTVSQDQIDLRSVKLKNDEKSQNKNLSRASKSKDKKSFLFPTTAQSQVTVKSAEQGKMKNSRVTEMMDEKFSQKLERNRNKRQKSPIRQLQENRIQIGDDRNEEYESSRDENFFSRFTNTLSQLGGMRQVSINKQEVKKKRHKQDKLQQKQDILREKQQRVKQRQQNGYKEDEETKNGSIQFRMVMANKKIKSLQRENVQLKTDSVRLKQIIQQLIDEKSQKEISENSVNSKIEQQLEQYKKTVIQKEMRINQLEGLNKMVINREEQKQKENKGLKNEVKQLKMKLQHQKNKLAKVLQTAMQTQNLDLLQIIEKQLNDQFY